VVLRGDSNQIFIGEGANIQDNSVVHTNDTDPPTYIGPDVTIGHGAILEGCRIERGSLIGMNTVVLGGAVVGEGSLVAAGSVVAAGAQIPARHLAAGSPAVVKRPISGSAAHWLETAAPEYHHFREKYLKLGLGQKYD
jgi:carbonic anhydrase/acetyltransferase-like protein (isoleucine patch superfamily)